MKAIPKVLRTLVTCALATGVPAQYLLYQSLGLTAGGRLGHAIAGTGDLDGDGIADVLVVQSNTGAGGSYNGMVYAISGATKRTLYGVPVRFAPAGSLVALGDVDGDGKPDFSVSSTVVTTQTSYDTIQIRSGANGSVLRSHGTATNPSPGAICDLGDVDQDGRSDYAHVFKIGSLNHVAVVSGATGAQINVVLTWNTNAAVARLHAVGDLSGDGKPEVVCTLETVPAVLLNVFQSVAMRTLGPTGAGSGFGLASAVGDVSGDGKPELVITYSSQTVPGSGGQGSANVYSLTTGALLRTFAMPNVPEWSRSQLSDQVTALSDLDGDGSMDFALLDKGGTASRVHVFSGRTGAHLATWSDFAPVDFYDAVLASIGDQNGDGVRDLLIGMPRFDNAELGGWQMVSGRILATVQTLTVGCHGGPFGPQLGISRPLVGQPMVLAGRDGPFNSPGIVLLASRANQPIFLGAAGCFAHVDLANAIVVHAPPPGPTWTATLPIPADITLAGFAFALQAFYAPTTGPLGFDASDAVLGRIGY